MQLQNTALKFIRPPSEPDASPHARPPAPPPPPPSKTRPPAGRLCSAAAAAARPVHPAGRAAAARQQGGRTAAARGAGAGRGWRARRSARKSRRQGRSHASIVWHTLFPSVLHFSVLSSSLLLCPSSFLSLLLFTSSYLNFSSSLWTKAQNGSSVSFWQWHGRAADVGFAGPRRPAPRPGSPTRC